LQARRARLQESTRALNAVSPLATLQRGYAILFDERGRVIRSAAGIAPGATVDARLVDGTVRLHRGGE
jgi:exodeoxyribonuclease VII large subunit